MALEWTKAKITQGFGPTSEKLDGPYKGASNFNKGYDYSLPIGTPIDSNVSGTVISAGDSGDGWGISVKVRDDQGNIHNFGHLNGVSVKPGQKVNMGTILGQSGNTGKSTGPHLSYDVKTAAGEYVDPGQWVSSGGGRAPAASGVQPVTQQEDSGDIFDRIGSLLGQAGAKAKNAQDADTQRTLGMIPQPVGDFATDAGAYWQAAQDAYSELAQYQATSTNVIIVDEGAGEVYVYDPENSITDDGLVLDPKGTAILQRALLNVANLDRLYAAKNAGLIQTGEGAAAAFLASEKEKAAAAAASYDDYVKRVSDLVAIEDIPNQRVATLGAALKAINSNDQGRTLAPKMGLSGRPQQTDTSIFANAIKSTIPAQAPQPYSINPTALEPIQPDFMKIPMRQPDEILASMGTAGPPSVNIGQPQSTPSGPPSVTIGQQQPTLGSYNLNMTGKRPFILPNPTQTIDQVVSGIRGRTPWQ